MRRDENWSSVLRYMRTVRFTTNEHAVYPDIFIEFIRATTLVAMIDPQGLVLHSERQVL